MPFPNLTDNFDTSRDVESFMGFVGSKNDVLNNLSKAGNESIIGTNAGGLNRTETPEEKKKREEAELRHISATAQAYIDKTNEELQRQIEALQTEWDKKKTEDNSLKTKQDDLNWYMQAHLNGTLDTPENQERKERVEQDNSDIDFEELRNDATNESLINTIKGKVGEIQTSRDQLQTEMDNIQGMIDKRKAAAMQMMGAKSEAEAKQILENNGLTEMNTEGLSAQEITLKLFEENGKDEDQIQTKTNTFNAEGQVEDYMKSFAYYIEGDITQETMRRITKELGEEAMSVVSSDPIVAEHMKEFTREQHTRPEQLTINNDEKLDYSSPAMPSNGAVN